MIKQSLITILLISITFHISYTSYVFASNVDEVNPIWLNRTEPDESVAPPNGFTVTPKEAFEIVRKKPWALSLKHVWHLYADSRYYYVHDSFLGSNSSLAKSHGVKVDGKTGEILNR